MNLFIAFKIDLINNQVNKTFRKKISYRIRFVSIGIVYCLSQKDAEDVCVALQKFGIKAGCYHAGLSGLARTHVHEKWIKNQVHVICATIAFGLFARIQRKL